MQGVRSSIMLLEERYGKFWDDSSGTLSADSERTADFTPRSLDFQDNIRPTFPESQLN